MSPVPKPVAGWRASGRSRWCCGRCRWVPSHGGGAGERHGCVDRRRRNLPARVALHVRASKAPKPVSRVTYALWRGGSRRCPSCRGRPRRTAHQPGQRRRRCGRFRPSPQTRSDIARTVEQRTRQGTRAHEWRARRGQRDHAATSDAREAPPATRCPTGGATRPAAACTSLTSARASGRMITRGALTASAARARLTNREHSAFLECFPADRRPDRGGCCGGRCCSGSAGGCKRSQGAHG